jgi:hypothetical protein
VAVAIHQGKQQIITFKADGTLIQALEGIQNRSEFIRSAILAALEGVCPLCRGTGVLSPNQSSHWREFCQNHSVETCEECNEGRIVCAAESTQKLAGKSVL